MAQKKILNISEILIIVAFAFFPLFLSFPFRVNIFLSWEGAYRLSNGQLPFRDFGIPLGGMYWVVPAIFFKIFGAQLITLVKAQVFINIVSGLVFRHILVTLSVTPVVRAASVLLYTITFSFFNFWPWYNHTAIVYGLIAVAFVLQFVFSGNHRTKWIWLSLASVFTFFSFFSKQDAGGLIFLICIFLLLYNSWVEKQWLGSVAYVGGTILVTSITVLFFSQYDFSYWFNYGQAPHNARVSGADIVNEFFSESQWLKFYFFLIILLAVAGFKDARSFFADKRSMIFLLLTIGILCLAAIFQITSYTPVNSNIFFHSFAFAFIMHYLLKYLNVKVNSPVIVILLFAGVMLWWSQLYWNYIQRIFIKPNREEGIVYSATGENVVGLHNARLKSGGPSAVISQGEWINSNIPALKKIKLPEPTVKGIQRLLELDAAKNKKDIRVLNMSELTFLAAEMPYTLERNPKFPLWYHLGVGMFNREAEMLENRIRDNYYDIVLFEYMPGLNNFYPFRVRDSLRLHYQQIDSFPAPRSSEPGTIEVYIKKQ
ncbi:hypothetical protein [Agriterribacter sp.]|uniref:hypothetical protein n=1 Tax=Agriterribacter sp. TaxID=2821509 RepID=UPI002CE439D7|nr:hypothetical protein [Agriterribacter sp.]HRO47883.1 hypothetical protein [Agriterribacter sp.]HRQ18821.1 hypothetical protein [Agriterribacter sp.]